MREDTIEIREVAGALRRGWRWIVGGSVLGVVLALVIGTLLPPRYEARSLVLLRSGAERSAISIASLGGGGGLGGLLPRSMQSGFETEIELLTSRTGVEAVVDSLYLQAEVRSPRGMPATELISSARFDPRARTATYTFRREGSGYRISGGGAERAVGAGEPVRLGTSEVTLKAQAVPDEFRIRIVSREEAVRRVSDRLEVRNPGGDVAQLAYGAPDPITAAAVPNALVANYMVRRSTSDRGVNQRRYEFLLERVDSVERALALAEEERRRYQEATGRFDPEIYAHADLERATSLRAELETLDMEAQALGRLIQTGASGDLSPRDLAAYPTFLRNQAINDLLSRLLELEQERLEVLERRLERDPDVIGVEQRIAQLEGQLVSLSGAYLDGVRMQQEQVRQKLGEYERMLSDVPGVAQSALRLYRDVERLSEISTVLHGQLLEARLDAISEGGDVRQIDAAAPPLEPEFPKTWLNVLIGLIGGMFLGVVGALGRSAMGERVEHPREAELAAGRPVVAFRPGSPLLLGNGPEVAGVLVLPVGKGAGGRTVAEHMAATAALRGREVALADLSGESTGVHANGAAAPAKVGRGTAEGGGGALVPASGTVDGYAVYRSNGGVREAAGEVRREVSRLEDRFSLVITCLPGLEDPVTTALLAPERPIVIAARVGGVTRTELRETVSALDRAGIVTAGVVLSERSGNGKRGR